MQRAEEGVGQKTVSDGVGMNHPPTAGRQELDAIQRISSDKLKGHQQAAQHGNEEVRQGRVEVPADQPFFHQIGMPRCVCGKGCCFVHDYSVRTR
jgi:hypothetical protein